MRWLALAVASGCGFTHGALDTTDDASRTDSDGDATDAAIDARIDAPLCNAADLDLRSCFTFDGSVTEGSGYSHGTSTANLSYVAGQDKQAVVIQSGSNITITGNESSFNVTTFTIRMWIKPTSLPASNTRMGLLDSGNRYRLFLMPGGALRCAMTSGPDLTSPTGIVTAGVWQRVACTFDGTHTRIYVDGTERASLMQTFTVQTSSSGIVIGQNNPSGENFIGAVTLAELACI